MKYYKSELNKDTLDLFDDININLFNVEGDGWKISIIIPIFATEKSLENLWEEVSNGIASTFQLCLKGKEHQFEKWNLYIIYVCLDRIGKKLKSKIENDKFSSRKIVEDKFVGELTNDNAKKLIIKYITNTDLVDFVNETIKSTDMNYDPINPKFWKLIPKDILVAGNTNLQKKVLEKFKLIENEN